MIDLPTQKKIHKLAQDYWDSEVQLPYFVKLAQGKEIGHRIADLVDEKTTALLTVNFLTKHEANSAGEKLTRSMGDVWLEAGGIYHPINVKTGAAENPGQPNMVSMKKLIDSLISRQIDSYYLLMVKIDITTAIKARVYLVDMLDYIDFITFDSGPGQIMLKAQKFFSAMEGGYKVREKSLQEKISNLAEKLEDGERRLRENRARGLIEIKKQIKSYFDAEAFTVTPATQAALRLV